MTSLVDEFDRIVAGDCITDDVSRHQEVVSAIRSVLKRERQPVREDYNELTTAFARILFHWKYPSLPSDTSPEARDRLMREYFEGGSGAVYGMAHVVLRALVAAALRGRDRIGLPVEERQRRDAEVQMQTERVLRELGGSMGVSTVREVLDVQLRANELYNLQFEVQKNAAGGCKCPHCQELNPSVSFTCIHCGKSLFGLEPPE